MKKEEHDRLVESFRSLGLSDSQAETAARGRNPEPLAEERREEAKSLEEAWHLEPTDGDLERAFEGVGLSESAAKIAARGH